MNKNIVITIVGLSIFFLVMSNQNTISFAQKIDNPLQIPLNFKTFEFSEKKDALNNISSIDIELPSSTWDITYIEMNFTDIEYDKREIKIIEGNPLNDDLFLSKNNIEELAVQIKLNDTIKIFGIYLDIKTILPHTLDEIYLQIRGYNTSINAPNSTIYGSVDLNHTIVDGWNYQNFTTPITLPKGNYSCVIGGFIQAAGEYHWYYNDLNPNYPDLYRSENDGTGWINGIQGSPFLYKLDQEVKYNDVYPEEFNMTAEINGNSYKILNSTHIGSGILKLSDIDISPNDEILYIAIKPNKFFFTTNYHLKMNNQFLSNAFIYVSEKEDNIWKIIPEINRCNYNYSIKIELPNNWYNLVVTKDHIDITTSEDILIDGNFLSILNNSINAVAYWEISAQSPKIDFSLDLSRGTKFKVGEELIFSTIAPIREGNFTFILYNKLGAEIDKRIIPVTSDETIYSFKIASNASLGTWTANIYWNSHNDAGVKSQDFTISPTPLDSNLILIIIIGALVGGGSVTSLTVYQTIKRKKRNIDLKLKSISNKFKDILSLNYLMISDIKSGVNVYEQFFMGKFMDPSLISGFLDAIRNFGIELTGSYKKSETLSLDYEDSIILMNESEDFRIIIVMSEKPSEEFTSLITNLAKDIEEKYGDLLRKFKGGQVTQFAGLSELIERHLNVSFASPLEIVFQKKAKLNTAEKSIIEKANVIMNQTNLNYFYTSLLMPDQKFDPDMTKVIFGLINKKVFQPISLNFEE
ncbi:MAG: hypothetical protein ACFFB0_15910 [Promethearchaeota archaeon]